MNKPSDLKVRQAVEAIFHLDSDGFDLSHTGTELKSRVLLRHWPLSRVERLTFRSEQLPSLIFKAVSEPMLGELAVYQDLFGGSHSEASQWAPNLYGYQHQTGELWLFLEDVGTRLLKNEATIENLNLAVTALASMHVEFGREVANGNLQQRSRLPVHEFDTYTTNAQQTLVLTRALVNKNLFTHVTNRHLSKLEAIVNMYERVAIGLMSAPQTVVHGDFYADNIALTGDERIIMLDWANSHIGAGLIDMVDLATFATSQYGLEILPRMLQTYRTTYRANSGQPLDSEPLQELFLCCQLEKKMSMIRWFCQCSLKWIPTGVEAYNFMVAGLIEETYELSTILV